MLKSRFLNAIIQEEEPGILGKINSRTEQAKYKMIVEHLVVLINSKITHSRIVSNTGTNIKQLPMAKGETILAEINFKNLVITQKNKITIHESIFDENKS